MKFIHISFQKVISLQSSFQFFGHFLFQNNPIELPPRGANAALDAEEREAEEERKREFAREKDDIKVRKEKQDLPVCDVLSKIISMVGWIPSYVWNL